MSFNGACVSIPYPCPADNKFYVDPCDCKSYIRCPAGQYTVVRQTCANGTLWDHEDNVCADENLVLVGKGLCELDEPWTRCETLYPDEYDEDALENLCDPSGTQPPPDDKNGGGGDSNTAAIVGGILGGLLVIAVIIIVICVVKRKKRGGKDRSNSYKVRQENAQNEAKDEEEVYDVINDKIVEQPYEEGIEYDNPAFKDTQEDKGKLDTGYSLGGASVMPEPTRYSTLSAQDSEDKTRSYSTIRTEQELDLSRSVHIEGKEVTIQDTEGYEVGYPSGTIPRQPMATQDRLGANSDNTKPDYFVLETKDGK